MSPIGLTERGAIACETMTRHAHVAHPQSRVLLLAFFLSIPWISSRQDYQYKSASVADIVP